MAYLSNNNDNNKSNNLASKSINDNKSTTRKPKNYNNNGYKSVNNYNQQSQNSAQIQDTLQKVKEKQKKYAAKKAIVAGMNAVAPGIGGVAAEKALETEKGEKLLDAYAKADSPQEGIRNVQKELTKNKNIIRIILFLLPFFSTILVIILLMTLIFKNADSQIFSNENGGTVESDKYGYDDPDTNIFANYPGLYEKVVSMSDKVSDEYQLEIDKFLIIATLISPIENGLIVPVDDNSCGEEECYYFNGESLTWSEFLDSWGDQSELLAKMQIMTYVNPASDINVDCEFDNTMEQYAQNDLPINTFPWWGWLNPFNWFKGFTDSVKAEVNAVCVDAPSGKTKVPTIYTLSTEQGIYYLTNNANNEYEYEKEPDSGGIYFWNLVNKNGFIHEYLKDYLSSEYSSDPDKNYEINKSTIIETANYIYSYYDSIKKTCEGHKVLESSLETINVCGEDGGCSDVDFEDQYIGGVLLAEYNSGDLESMKAFAILARSYAVSIVGLDGSGSIENSSNNQNYNSSYSPSEYPKIAQAVEETRGMVLSKYNDPEVWSTEYDAFCPVKNVLDNGFYYLDDEQQNLPINPEAFEKITGREFIDSESRYLDCPCFQNNDSRPHDEDADKNTRFYFSNTIPPTFPGGTPYQETKEVCWKKDGSTKTDEDGSTLYGWKYKPSGGHGRGASQYGLRYFEAFGYDRDALLRMFFEGANVRVLSSSLKDGKCQEVPYYYG